MACGIGLPETALSPFQIPNVHAAFRDCKFFKTTYNSCCIIIVIFQMIGVSGGNQKLTCRMIAVVERREHDEQTSQANQASPYQGGACGLRAVRLWLWSSMEPVLLETM